MPKMFKISLKQILALLLLAVLSSNVAAAEMSEQAKKFHKKFTKDTPVYDDPELQAYVTEIGNSIVKSSNRPNANFHFYVLDSEQVNAIAVSDNIVYLYRGLLTMMNSEGQLAAVIAHEIAHHTANHETRLKSRSVFNDLGEFFASVFVGNGNVGRAMDVANNARLMKFKRKMELEADELGAQFLYNAKYDPQEMLEMLSVLNDHSKLISITKDINTSYHGVFATHPRSDKRLKAAIDKAGEHPPGENIVGRERFRKALDGVVFGRNSTQGVKPNYKRYLHRGLGITFVYPKDWNLVLKGSKLILKDADKTIQLKIMVEKTVDKTLDTEAILKAKYPKDLKKITKVDPEATKDLGAYAKRPQQRVAAFKVGRNTFHIQGIARNNQLSKQDDELMVEIIRSFRRATKKDLPPDEIKKIYFERLEPGETFKTLAKDRTLGKYTEQYLRAINGYYPKGEPEPGTYIKLVRSVKDKLQLEQAKQN